MGRGSAARGCALVLLTSALGAPAWAQEATAPAEGSPDEAASSPLGAGAEPGAAGLVETGTGEPEPALEPETTRRGAASTGGWPRERPALEIETADGGTSLRFRFVAQLQLDYDVLDRGAGGLEHEASLFMRRVRPDLTGTVLTRDLSYRLYLNLVPGALELMELWLDYRFHDQARVTVGVVKEPYTRYRLNSFQDLPFVDWSNPTRWFGADRQVGLMLHNGLGRPPALEYQLGLFTGVNWRASSAIGMSRVHGERPGNPSSLVNPSFPDAFHPELVAHVGYSHGGMNARTSTDFEGGPPRFHLGFSGAWDFAPNPIEDMTFRFAPEALFKAHGFFAQGVFHLGGYDEAAGVRIARLGLLGTVLQAGYLVAGRYEVAARYTLVYVLPDLRADARARADRLVDDAPDEAAAEALRERYSAVGRVVAEHDIGLAVGFYLVGTALVLRVDGALLVHSRVGEDGHDGRLRVMLQLAI